MKERTGVDLENIVYYKDDTHYFVMCAKKQSLIEKGVICEEKLCEYAMQAADFATEYRLPELKFSKNHNQREDVAMFDFTSLFSAKCSVRLFERFGQRLLVSIVGDTLHEPFWPTGSGCARGFLGVLDTAWMMRAYGLNQDGIMLVLAERESVYRLLAQTTPDNLHKQLQKYTIDPRTRYISVELNSVQPHEVSYLVDTDNPRNIDTSRALPLRVDERCDLDIEEEAKFDENWDDFRAVMALLGKYHPEAVDYISMCCCDDMDANVLAVKEAVKTLFDIELPFDSYKEWAELSEGSRVEYLAKIVNFIKNDKMKLKNILFNQLRAAGTLAHKRKAIHSQ
ncbi:unnamed protein product, partial [Anisakis simplex]|uniref:Protein-methionine sulfoxide oxidase MICAL2 (inferred by orthology to a human protein) n=1 Tax=Anisakis simplex TaxID=6269 RepID=A0A0M3J2N6_ANISI